MIPSAPSSFNPGPVYTSLDLLEQRMLVACAASAGSTNPCLQAAREHLAAGGTRLRARICLDTATRLGLGREDAFCAAVACELLHNASLIQDDLLDRTPTRRGKPSVWFTHGDTVAVCTGDLMLSSAYGALGELSVPTLVSPALRLVHQRTSEIILGQAVEATPPCGQENTLAYFERVAKGKSASLLSLSLELPLLLSGNTLYLPAAHSIASNFAVAYQIADDLADLAQDMQEGSPNLLLLLIERDGVTRSQACTAAIELAMARVAAAEEQAKLLPNDCAATLLGHAGKLRQAFDHHRIPAVAMTPLATAGV